MNYINELREGDMLSEIYLCKNKVTAKTKAGKNYYSLVLQDKTGTIDAKVWELNSGISHFENMDYIKVEAQVTAFNNALQLNVKRIRVADAGEYDPSDYMPCSDKSTDSMYGELMDIISTISNTYLKQLLDMYFVSDKDFIEKFKKHSAAKSIHHGFIGGLLEHTLSVAKICQFIADNYPKINRDLLITAAIFHDMGKIDEIADFPVNDYTDEGQLIGHIVMGTIMLDRSIKEIPNFPVKLANELKHCILAHHGELEYGSPKKPALIEALALSHADNMDAKLQSFTELINSNQDNHEWLGFNRMFDSNVRLTSE